MNEKELAQRMVRAAGCSHNNIGIKYKGSIMDYQEYFGNGEYDLTLFKQECDKLGYDVIPLEQSPMRCMPLVGKLVVQNRR